MPKDRFDIDYGTDANLALGNSLIKVRSDQYLREGAPASLRPNSGLTSWLAAPRQQVLQLWTWMLDEDNDWNEHSWSFRMDGHARGIASVRPLRLPGFDKYYDEVTKLQPVKIEVHEGTASPIHYYYAPMQGAQTRRSLFVYRDKRWYPWTADPWQSDGKDYREECTRLQATPAGRKAKQLLLDNLTDEQQRDYYKRGVFTVRSGVKKDGFFQYFLIDNSFPNGNIFEVKNHKTVANYCCHPAEPYPLDDILLTQKLMIETDIEGFLEMGNKGSVEGRVVPTIARGYL